MEEIANTAQNSVLTDAEEKARRHFERKMRLVKEHNSIVLAPRVRDLHYLAQMLYASDRAINPCFCSARTLSRTSSAVAALSNEITIKSLMGCSFACLCRLCRLCRNMQPYAVTCTGSHRCELICAWCNPWATARGSFALIVVNSAALVQREMSGRQGFSPALQLARRVRRAPVARRRP